MALRSFHTELAHRLRCGLLPSIERVAPKKRGSLAKKVNTHFGCRREAEINGLATLAGNLTSAKCSLRSAIRRKTLVKFVQLFCPANVYASLK